MAYHMALCIVPCLQLQIRKPAVSLADFFMFGRAANLLCCCFGLFNRNASQLCIQNDRHEPADWFSGPHNYFCSNAKLNWSYTGEAA